METSCYSEKIKKNLKLVLEGISTVLANSGCPVGRIISSQVLSLGAANKRMFPNASEVPQMVFSLEACLVATALESLETTYLFGSCGGTLVGKF